MTTLDTRLQAIRDVTKVRANRMLSVITVRMKPALHEKLKREAHANQVSLNNYILAVLEQVLEGK